MSKRKRQQSLFSLLSNKRVRSEVSEDQGGGGDKSISPEPHDDQVNEVSIPEVETPSIDDNGSPVIVEGSQTSCTRECCSNFEKTSQPTDKPALNSLATDKRRRGRGGSCLPWQFLTHHQLYSCFLSKLVLFTRFRNFPQQKY